MRRGGLVGDGGRYLGAGVRDGVIGVGAAHLRTPPPGTRSRARIRRDRPTQDPPPPAARTPTRPRPPAPRRWGIGARGLRVVGRAPWTHAHPEVQMGDAARVRAHRWGRDAADPRRWGARPKAAPTLRSRWGARRPRRASETPTPPGSPPEPNRCATVNIEHAFGSEART